MSDLIPLFKELSGFSLILFIGLGVLYMFFVRKLNEGEANHLTELRQIEEMHKASINSHFDKVKLELQSNQKKVEELYKKHLEYDFSIDENLRKERLASYRRLWEKMILLSEYPKNNTLTKTELQQLCLDFRDWYFKEGGIFLSEEARKRYELVQKELNKSFTEPNMKITDVYDNIRKACSHLRSQFTEDLQSRRGIKKF